jgi:hypothetical protein
MELDNTCRNVRGGTETELYGVNQSPHEDGEVSKDKK